MKESEALMKEATEHVRKIVEDNISLGKIEWSVLKQNIRDDLGKFLYDETKRRPMIIPIISEI